MNKCQVEWVDQKKVKISGIIDEFSDFSNLFNNDLEEIWIDFSGISRINSSGIREWVQAVMKSTSRLFMVNCSAVIIDQFSMIPECVGKNGQVVSFYVHYICDHCDHELQEVLTVGKDADSDTVFNEERESPCPACGGVMELDHNPDTYFSFLKDLKAG